ncbi:MCM complex subunit Mcm5 [Schizosaccharomyces japonicus yFS275]|uniref:DNA replication licensing factor MCM5 n=1 Tax=Schizosaccharomyces japonicus (strain yFS275 / FY16936) TaxID=402676 RepID=B6K0G1_SCHJY|nr:MCM complex subunit Mcm5 [Schizosaccharomyces japonicus yFS275]EEB06311.1 MCM complex subunit Mcm5 [Schizosaccharomyces japonicus yFS275]
MAATGWEQSNIYYTPVLPGEQQEDSKANYERSFVRFLEEFVIDGNFVYRTQLRDNLLVKKYCLEVEVKHLISFNEDLAHLLSSEPAEMLPLFESAITTVAKRLLFPRDQEAVEIPTCQLILRSDANVLSIRDLNAAHISRLVRVPGIIIGASTLSCRATKLHLVCRSCGNSKSIFVTGGFSGIQIPRVCDSPVLEGERKDCPMDPYIIDHSRSTFIDQQVLKLQEAPDMVPVGELPRHVLLNADRYLTNLISPGTRCVITGIFSIFQNKAVKANGAVAIRNPYIRVLGIQRNDDDGTKSIPLFSEEEEEQFLEISRTPNLYQIIANSIAPAIYGNEDIKRAIACLLFSGSKKILPDGMRLRGDINVLLLGDPGTAKSQFLKFVERAAPIAVYTSGKGSSAAGLTASVQRDAATREFYLEGGAMVLADGGVVCVDEFDKMRDEDRVAIHEAMEQQTISIAKAGITTILNSRTSVLAAANPIFGRYDEMKSPGENIDFQTTILSRFDMIFIVRDEHDETRDKNIAKHVISLHTNLQDAPETLAIGEIPLDIFRRYINYCRHRCAPVLTAEAAEKLSSQFVSIRKRVHQVESESNERSTIPITVRQLEAIIRITEALAKMTLSSVATEEHANEAIRLFLTSTLAAATSNSPEVTEEVKKIEASLRKRLPIGFQASYRMLVREYVNGHGYSQRALEMALQILAGKETIQMRNGGQTVYRAGV